VGDGDERRAEEQVEERKKWGNYIPTITFHSPGGDLLAGVRLGKLIRDERLDTSVGQTLPDNYNHHEIVSGICSSACVFALMGGVERAIGAERSRVGVHQFYDSRALSDLDAFQFSAKDTMVQQALMGVLVAYVKGMGIDTDILFRAAMIPPTSIQWLTPEEIVTFNLDNMTDRQKDWKIEPYKTGIVAQTSAATGPREPENLSVYCERSVNSKTVKLVYSSRLLVGVDPIEIREASFDYEIRAGDAVIRKKELDDTVRIRRGQDNILYVSFDVNQEAIGVFLALGQVNARINLPHSLNWGIGRSFTTKGAAPYITAAMNNCVSS